MADIVVAVDISDSVLTQVAHQTGVAILRSAHDRAVGDIDDTTTIAVIANASCGIELAQAAHRAAPDIAVVFLTDDTAMRDELAKRLSITPGISRHTVCVLAHQPDTDALVVDEIERSRLRKKHHRTMAQIRGALSEIEAATSDTLPLYLDRLFDQVPIGIMLVEPSGAIRVANPASGEVLGWQPRHAVGLSVPSMFTGRDAQLAADLFTDCLASGERVMETLCRTGPGGYTQHLEVTVAPVDPGRLYLGVFVLLRDESARVHALEATDKARKVAETETARYAELAKTLQESLLPPELPDIAGIDIGASFHPAGDGSQIGGDFYDVFALNDDEWCAVIGDVCGKGAEAARLTGLTRYTLRATTVSVRSLEANLVHLNNALVRQYEQDSLRAKQRFATATVVRFRADEDGVVVEAGSGGHPPALIVRADGTIEELACRGPLLGVFPDGTFVTAQTRLAARDMIVLYTDGVTEARRDSEQFGDQRLWKLLSTTVGRSASDVAAAVQGAALDFQGGTARDDIAVLAVGPSPRA